jgi:hypothetical protein
VSCQNPWASLDRDYLHRAAMISELMAATPPTRSSAFDPDDPSQVVAALRDALRRRDAEAVQALRWLAPRPPGERDLFSDLAAGEGVEAAIRRLASFWRKAEVRLERVRTVSDREVEVYERMSVSGESLPIVSLVRRPELHAPWRVVCTNEAHDERFAIWLASGETAIDDVAWSRMFEESWGESADLIMDGASGVLGNPARGWLAHVRGPFTPRAWPEQLPGEGGQVIELTTGLTPESEDRHAQLEWILAAASVFLEQAGGPASYFPTHEKLVLPQALIAAAQGDLTADQSVRFWARLDEIDQHIVTTGLRQLGLPEIEAPVGLGDDPTIAPSLVRWLGGKMVEDQTVPMVGTELVLGDRMFTIGPGRRGPRRGKSYGRWGAVRIGMPDPFDRRGSRTRIRVSV